MGILDIHQLSIPNHKTMVMIVNSGLNTIPTFATPFATILDISQVLAHPRGQDELLCQLAQMGIQQSGSDRCCLIIPNHDGVWTVVVIATPDATERCSVSLEDSSDLPIKLIRYVIKTQEPLFSNDHDNHLPIVEDVDQEIQHCPKSLICLPILHQGQVLGILYGDYGDQSESFSADKQRSPWIRLDWSKQSNRQN